MTGAASTAAPRRPRPHPAGRRLLRSTAVSQPPPPSSTALRGPPGAGGVAGVLAFERAGGDASRADVRDVVGLVAEHAPGLFGLLTSDVTLAADVLDPPLDRDEEPGALAARIAAATRDLGDDDALRRTLRRLRHRAIVRIALREVLGLADIDRTSAEMAELADACIDAALRACLHAATARHGVALGPGGAPVPLVVLGMGKLGGRELNLGSDVDLAFFYETDDAIVGDGLGVTVHELYGRVASRTAKALAEVTDDGFVFRVDLRLRPEGSRGPLVNSLASAERYYETFGATWERGALLRARPVAGDVPFGERLLSTLAPFVWRREVRPAVVGEMASMVERARLELGAHDDDVKLGRGGIREAEFFVQSLQLVWGGRHPELRVANTIESARRLRAAGLLSDRELTTLESAWALLRRVEHRIHATAGYQTHVVPTAPSAREAFARSLGFGSAGAFERALSIARGNVAALFDSLLTEDGVDPDQAAAAALVLRAAEGDDAEALAREAAALLRVTAPEEAAAHLTRLARWAPSPFGAAGRAHHPALAPRLLLEVRDAIDPDQALAYLADFFARLGGGWSYDRLLDDEPRHARRLVALFGASATLASALVRHPESLDALVAVRGAPSIEAVRAAHAAVADGAPHDDTERFVAELRRRKRELVLGIGLAHTDGELDLDAVESRLSELADQQLRAALAHVSRGAAPQLAVVALGKHGARELGFGSDLDLMFVYGAGEDDGAALGEMTRIAQRAMRLLSQPDAEGEGYTTDVRLRPGGSQGLLVVSLAAFDRYHASRADGWERQALLRARVVAGPAELRRALETRFEALVYERPPPAPTEIAALRRRMELELAGERGGTRLHPKFGHGALLDVELAVQWLQMAHGHEPAVRGRRTADAIDALGAAGVLDPDEVAALRQGHGFFRAVQQALRLVDPAASDGLLLGSRTASRVARVLGLRARDGRDPVAVLLETWSRRAREVRHVFESRVAPIDVPPPFATTQPPPSPR